MNHNTVPKHCNNLHTNHTTKKITTQVSERDLYLAWSLKRSKAVNGARAVVGVVGRGHLRGVVHALRRDVGGGALRFSDLVDGRNRRSVRRAEAARRLAAEALVSGALYAAWLALTSGGGGEPAPGS